ncbi:MAG: gliding motility-associated C-terminal domain-containing protein [Chitinophagaceae bacterium]
MKKIKKNLLFSLFSLVSLFSAAQTDTAFWFAAPDISSDFSYDRPVMLRITSYSQPCVVTVFQPANGGMPPQTITLAPNSTQTVNLTTWLANIECGPGNIIQNNGLKIVSDNKISVYYEVNVNGPNPEIFALKGRNALGNQFYISSQYLLSNSSTYTPRPYSSFNIVATEDNTQVTIVPTQNITGHAANITFTISLNKGQTYAAIASSQAAAAHLQGSSVSSTKPIAITLSDDLLSGAEYGGICADMAGDQTVPITITGNEYIAFKSNLNSPFDKLYITATQNGTTITQDAVVVGTLNSGQTAQLTITNNVTYVQTSGPVYVYQLSGYGCEVGSAILPKINCTGSSSVSVTRSTNETFTLTLLVQNGGQSSFLVNGVAGVITNGNFNVVPGTGGQWYYAKVTLPSTTYPNGTVIRISNSTNLFQMGVLQGDISGVGFGYFSDYNSVKATASTNTPTLCRGSDLQLNSETIASATYGWTGPNSFISSLQNPLINNVTAINSGQYYLTVTVPGCGTYLDSVFVTVDNCENSIGSIINTYTPVLAFNPCENKITVEDASTFNVGDTVLMIQMKGAVIDSSNTPNFGLTTNYRNAGNYQINYVKSKAGNIIELKNILIRIYNIPDGKVQLIRVPYYSNATITSTLTCLPWDGNKGGVLVLNVQDTVSLLANIDVSGKGFKGGKGFSSGVPALNCFQNNYHYPQSSNASAGQKGESIATISPAINYGKGSSANGGGGGVGHNSGGGGGSNSGSGGFGGYQLDNCGSSPFDNRGIGGRPLVNSEALNKVFLGGGGGAGQADNPGNTLPDGGNGGGIVIIICDKLKTNNNKIISNGDNAIACSVPPSSDCHDGMGGGGAGGSVLLSINQFLDNTATEIKGGKGADMTGSVPLGGRIGGGGGGSGGLLFFKGSTVPANTVNTITGGANGILTQDAGSSWGATPGQNGLVFQNLNIPINNTPFRPNIDSVRIKDSLITCDNFDFKGLGYTNTNPVASWQWFFGDGGTANTQNTSHTYAPGFYTVKLVVTDINGCKDSISRNITASILTMDAGPNDTICSINSTILQATANGATQYTWTPVAFLNNPTILNPTATPPVTTMFYLTASNAFGCSRLDSVLVTVRSANAFSIIPPTNICSTKTIQLNASGGDLYVWQPAGSLNNPDIYNPTASPSSTTTYSVQITDTLCNNVQTLSTTISVLPLPSIRANKSNDIDCTMPQSQLIASGGVQYSWTPTGTLSNPNSGSTIASPAVTTQYVVTGTDFSGCINYDSVVVNVTNLNKGGYLMPTGFTPNNDGLNDCYGIKYWGTILDLEFSIYNRWGERIFFTKNPTDCWDGRYKGLPQDAAVFIYMIKARTTCEGSIFRKGTFTLIR